MKRFVLCAVVPALFAQASPAFASDPGPASRIEVMLYFKNEGAVGTTLPPIDGNESQSDGRIGNQPNETCHFSGWYRVIKSPQGKFRVLVHYAVYLDAPKETLLIDRNLNVFPKAPPGDDNGAIRVASGVRAGAHFIDNNDTIRD